MILRARSVVTMTSPPITNGAVVTDGDRIVDVDRFDDVKARRTGEIVDLGERTLLPGLINAHCHLDYTCLRGKIPRPQSFTDWIGEINAAKAALLPNDYIESIDEGFAETQRFGTTTVVNLTAFPELIAKITPPVRAFWCPELIDVRAPEEANELVDHAVGLVSATGHWGLAPHAPFTASPALYRRCEELAPFVTTHVAESANEMSMFRDAAGPLYEFLKEIGRNMTDCGGTTPLARAIEVNRPCLVAHLNELSEGDFDLLRRSTTKFSIVHCPRSHQYFGHSRFQFERLRELGFNICLGTDSLASNEDLSLFAEMRAFRARYPTVSAEEVLKMVTINPARALRCEDHIGAIKDGAAADLVAIPDNGGDVFEQILTFAGEPWVMAGGRVPPP